MLKCAHSLVHACLCQHDCVSGESLSLHSGFMCVCVCDARTLSSYILVKRPGDSEQPILSCRGALCLCVQACVGVAFV